MFNRKFYILLLLFVVAQPIFSQRQQNPTGNLVIANNGEGKALIARADTLEILFELPVGPSPHDLAVSRDGRFAYVAIMGTQSAPGNTIAVVDLRARSVQPAIGVGDNKLCHDVRVSRDGRLLWATCAPTNTVLEIDTATRRILKTWRLDDDGAWMLVVTPDEKKIYTANLEGKSVSVIDRRSNTVNSIKFASGQIGIDVSPSGREVWVHHIDESKISVIDMRTDKVIATFRSAGSGAGRLKFTPDGKYVLVPQNRSKNMAVFDARSRRQVADVQLSVEPKVITVSADSRKAFITSPSTNKVLVIDLATFQEINSAQLGKNTDGIAWALSARP